MDSCGDVDVVEVEVGGDVMPRVKEERGWMKLLHEWLIIDRMRHVVDVTTGC